MYQTHSRTYSNTSDGDNDNDNDNAAVSTEMCISGGLCVKAAGWFNKIWSFTLHKMGDDFYHCTVVSTTVCIHTYIHTYIHPYPHKHTSNMWRLKYEETWNSHSLNLSVPWSCQCIVLSTVTTVLAQCNVQKTKTTKPIAQSISITARPCTAVSWPTPL
jgi:hypothetical protein